MMSILLQRLGERVRELRQEAGVSPDELALRLAWPVSHVEQLEAGQHWFASADELESLADALDCEPTDIIAPPQDDADEEWAGYVEDDDAE